MDEVSAIMLANEIKPLPVLPAGADAPPPKEPEKAVYAPVRSKEADNPGPSAQFNERLLRSVLRIQTKSRHDKRMRDYLAAVVPMIAPDALIEMKNDNIYITKGQAKVYPAAVAHLDTVHTILPKGHFKVYNCKDQFFGWDEIDKKHVGVGGDDKVGIFLALELLRTLPALKVVFFRDEEIGCQGSHEADLAFFKDCAFVLQGDRRGNKDFVKRGGGQGLYNFAFDKEIAPHLKTHGFTTCYAGASTDVIALRAKGLTICAANVSCGYFNPHSATEYVVAGDVERTLLLFTDIIEDLGAKQWENPPETTSYWNGYQSTHYGGGYEYGRSRTFRPAYEPNTPISPGHWLAERFQKQALDRKAAAEKKPTVVNEAEEIARRLFGQEPDEASEFEDDDESFTNAQYRHTSRRIMEEEDDDAFGVFSAYDDGDYACPDCMDRGVVMPDEGAFGQLYCMTCQKYVQGD